MGEEIDCRQFTEAEHEAFRARLREETSTLKQWFDERRFDETDIYMSGLEVESWLVDQDALPAPENVPFLASMADDNIVEELSRFNFEINTPPHALERHALSVTQADLEAIWLKCTSHGANLGLRPAAIGILPTVRDEMLQPDWMSNGNRYHALNRELFWRRKEEPLHIDIRGEDELDYHCGHLMLEAACTSLQTHLKINQDDMVRHYNAGILAAAPLVAASANSPYLYGKSLWAETRIPAFEQATSMTGFRDSSGRNVLRVTLGTGYLRQCFLELFLENLSYPTLLPAMVKGRENLPHLRMQNGTIWRWVRPILGFDSCGTPHLRIEHRVMPSGPSVVDMTANLALCHGLVLGLAKADIPPETETCFEEARANFYACAKLGLKAEVSWAGEKGNVQALLLEKLLPLARSALAKLGLFEGDLVTYFDDVLTPRLLSGRTGADWQRSYVDCHGPDFQALTERYVTLQATGEPVHRWTI